ncbi:DUF5011 domain-containing protein [Listeria booriae]|uniref:LPXTG cell wall anchor domain-containing protein n=1 Tax=Listeria booriae TaxID=1552123 RepID=UPI0016269449|nr:immunoglobulin-like domain-containing protein [Listeria booriae]MBC2159783.1 DUF5011 domain-containing protein [Listeria booriae]
MKNKAIKVVASGCVAFAVIGGNTGVPNMIMQPIAVKAETSLQGVAKPPIEVISLENGSFEQPVIPKGFQNFDDSEVPGWKTTATDHLIEIQNHYENQEAADGNQYAELNAVQTSALYQDIETTPGATVRWHVAHKGRDGTDTAVVKFGSSDNLQVIATMSSSKDAWQIYSGTYTIPAGQTTTRFQFEAVSTAGGEPTRGNYLDDIVFATQSFITVSGEVDKTSVKKDKTATYSFDAKNEGGMASQNTVLSIPIPQEVTLDSPNAMVDGVSVAGSYDSSTRVLSIPLGNIEKDVTKHVTFDIKGATVANNVTTQAVVTHQDKGFTDEDYVNYSNDVTLNVIENIAPTITATDYTLKKGATFNPLADVSAADKEDGNLTSSVKVIESDVDTTKEGVYHVTYSVTDSDGNVVTKKVTVTIISNDAPTITAADQTLKKGSNFDPMADVSASDREDGDITQEVKITDSTVDTSQEGTYSVTYEVTDTDGNTAQKTVTVTVTSNDMPTITASDKTLKRGTEYDPMVEVSASDKEDGDITQEVKIIENTVDTSQEGTYSVTYEVTDSDGNTTQKTISVVVTSNEAPVIEAKDKILKKGDVFNPLTDVLAGDLEDGDITKSIQVIQNTVDMNQVGIYEVTYLVTDSDGNETTKKIQVTVLSNEKPGIIANDQTISVGDAFDPSKGVTVADLEDGDMTQDVKVIQNTVDTSKPGVYQVTYQVTDSDGNTTEKTIQVTVLPVIEPVVPSNPLPEESPIVVEPMAVPEEAVATPASTPLPKTGDTNDVSPIAIGSGIIALASLLLFRRKK